MINGKLFDMENNNGEYQFPTAYIGNIVDKEGNRFVVANGISFSATIIKTDNVVAITADSLASKIKIVPDFDYSKDYTYTYNGNITTLIGIGGRDIEYGWKAGTVAEFCVYVDGLELLNDRLPDIHNEILDTITADLSTMQIGDKLILNNDNKLVPYKDKVLHIYEAGQRKGIVKEINNTNNIALITVSLSTNNLYLSDNANNDTSVSTVAYKFKDINLSGYTDLIIKYKNGSQNTSNNGIISIYDKLGSLIISYNLVYSSIDIISDFQLSNCDDLVDITISISASGTENAQLSIFDFKAV